MLFYLGLGFGANIAILSASSQPDTNYIKGLILENGFYDLEHKEVEHYFKS